LLRPFHGRSVPISGVPVGGRGISVGGDGVAIGRRGTPVVRGGTPVSGGDQPVVRGGTPVSGSDQPVVLHAVERLDDSAPETDGEAAGDGGGPAVAGGPSPDPAVLSVIDIGSALVSALVAARLVLAGCVLLVGIVQHVTEGAEAPQRRYIAGLRLSVSLPGVMVAVVGIPVSGICFQIPIVGQVVTLFGEAVTTLGLTVTVPDTSLSVRHRSTRQSTLAS
jgi:hypothetical protein